MIKDEKEILDLLQNGVVQFTKQFLDKLDLPGGVTEEQAKALVGRIGIRIVFGKEVADPILMKQK